MKHWSLPRLSSRLLSERYNPDKAIDLIDEAASSLRMAIDSMPAALDQARREAMSISVGGNPERGYKPSDRRAPERARENWRSDRAGRLHGGSWRLEKDLIDAIAETKEAIESTEHRVAEVQRAETSGGC